GHRPAMDRDGITSRRQNGIAPASLVLDCELAVWLRRQRHQRCGHEKQKEICDVSSEFHCPISNRKLGDGRKSEQSVSICTTRARIRPPSGSLQRNYSARRNSKLLARSGSVERPALKQRARRQRSRDQLGWSECTSGSFAVERLWN